MILILNNRENWRGREDNFRREQPSRFGVLLPC